MATSPKVWSKFSATKNGVTVKFRAVEPPQNRISDVVEFIIEYLAKEETFFRGAGVSRSEEALAEYKEYLLETLSNGLIHTVICCLDDGNDEIGEIIGGSFIELTHKVKPQDFSDKMPQTKEMLKLLEIIFAVKDMYDVCEKLNVDKYYNGRGVVVHPKYRGYGIAQELFRTRRLICKEHDVPLTVAIMTAYGSQKAGERDNWETVFELNFEEFGKQVDVTFDGPEIAKLMVARPL